MVEQRTDEWKMERAGKFTASRFVDVMARDKRNPEKKLKAWSDLIWDIAVERLTGQPEEGPAGYALQWGTDVEPFAREAYELETGESVAESGFIVHPKYSFVGCSPDGLIGADGGIEMKCPKSSKVHVVRFLEGMPEDYTHQVQGCMWVTSRQWWDFVSFDPRMPEKHQLFIIRIARDDDYIKKLEAAVLEAEAEVQNILNTLSKAAA